MIEFTGVIISGMGIHGGFLVCHEHDLNLGWQWVTGFACEVNNIDIRLSDCSGINLASIIY
ncbi:MAG: hypothetical protein ACTTJV_03735 [Ottowia sp.]